MICVCIAEPRPESCEALLRDAEMAEIRLDGTNPGTAAIRRLFSLPLPLVATYRPLPGGPGEEHRKNALLTAIRSGAAYVDIEIEAPDAYRGAIIRAAREANNGKTGCRVIISYHNFDATPSRDELERIIGRCFDAGADIAKVACRVRDTADSARIMSLYDDGAGRRGRLLAVGMGENGVITRLAAPLLGAPFTFAVPEGGKQTAPGQVDAVTLKHIYGKLNLPTPVAGDREKGGTTLLAVTGNPVLHSKSPLMFNRVLGSDGVYCRIAASSAAGAVHMFRELGLSGMNVTAPFKREIMEHLDLIDDAARQIGGVNTVYPDGDRLKGTNTDHIGVVESLKRSHVSVSGRRVLVLGAGGAGRAAVYGLVRAGADVVLVNRTHRTARDVAAGYDGDGDDGGGRCRAEPIEQLEHLLKETHILVSTLAADIDIIPGAWLSPGLVVLDADYKRSGLAQKARDRGCRVLRGEDWLLNQALPAYRYFLGVPPGNDVLEGMRGALQVNPDSAARSMPRVIALVGFMGCGKTTVGRLLAEKLGFGFRDTDQLIEEREGSDIPRIFAHRGEAYFRRVEKTVLEDEMKKNDQEGGFGGMGGMVYGCGGGIVLDGDNRFLLREKALVIWLYCDIETTLKRIPPGTRPLLDGPDPASEARRLLEQRKVYYAGVSDLIVSGEVDAPEVAEQIHDEIRKTFGD